MKELKNVTSRSHMLSDSRWKTIIEKLFTKLITKSRKPLWSLKDLKLNYQQGCMQNSTGEEVENIRKTCFENFVHPGVDNVLQTCAPVGAEFDQSKFKALVICMKRRSICKILEVHLL